LAPTSSSERSYVTCTQPNHPTVPPLPAQVCPRADLLLRHPAARGLDSARQPSHGGGGAHAAPGPPAAASSQRALRVRAQTARREHARCTGTRISHRLRCPPSPAHPPPSPSTGVLTTQASRMNTRPLSLSLSLSLSDRYSHSVTRSRCPSSHTAAKPLIKIPLATCSPSPTLATCPPQAAATASEEEESLFGASLRLMRVWPCGPTAPACKFGRRMSVALGADLALSQMQATPILRVRTKVRGSPHCRPPPSQTSHWFSAGIPL
jgi:hypothetical protein